MIEQEIKTRGLSPLAYPKSVTHALRLTQGDLKNIAADQSNADFSWTSIDAVTAAILPIASHYKLAYSHDISYVAEPYPQVVCEMKLLHEDGEWISYSKTMPVDVDGSSIVQCVGAAQTYARRTQLLEVFGISSANMPDVDDRIPKASIVPATEPMITEELTSNLIERSSADGISLDGKELHSVLKKFDVKSWAGLRLVDYPAALKSVDKLLAEKKTAVSDVAQEKPGRPEFDPGTFDFDRPQLAVLKKAKKKAKKKSSKKEPT